MNDSPLTDANPADYWESRYSNAERMWSGKVNRVLAEVTATLEPGSALDLGCGEGGDAIWLAQQGWNVLGLDISTTAIQRATQAAREAGIPAERADFRAADITELALDEQFDLVTASFLHSPVKLERERILSNAIAHVAPGGHFLITSHAAPPPWATVFHEQIENGHAPPGFGSPDEEITSLGLDENHWQTKISEIRERNAVSPDGEPATLLDGVILLHRLLSD